MAKEQEYIFVKLGDIKGVATDANYKNQVVLQHMSYSINQAGHWEEQDKLSGRITTFSDLSVTKLLDASSPDRDRLRVKDTDPPGGHFRHLWDERLLL